MFKVDFHRPVRAHFIGIGGISMSGLAELLLSLGFRVSGSDNSESELVKQLRSSGAEITIGQCAENIRPDIGFVVYTAAIRESNPELKAAREAGLPVLSRAQFLGQVMANYRSSVAVAGTHGKTTTTGMITEILLAAAADPTVTIGGILDSIGGNLRIGHSEHFVAEACEYTNSFWEFSPRTGIILNIKEDHLDFFKDLEDIRRSFRRFAENIPEDGLLILGSGIEDGRRLMQGLRCRLITVGFNEEDDYRAADQSYSEMGHADFDLLQRGKKLGRISLRIPGHHNIYNALAAAAAMLEEGIPFEQVKKGLENFVGTRRRFEKKGELPGDILVMDDYAHHPDEIIATLKAARCYRRPVTCIFQPHTYSRTKALFDRFVEALSSCDRVILAKIYPARETDTLGMSSELLAAALRERGVAAQAFDSFADAEEHLRRTASPGEMLLTMGAGDVYRIGEELLGAAGTEKQ